MKIVLQNMKKLLFSQKVIRSGLFEHFDMQNNL